jgi:hypothetical protein
MVWYPEDAMSANTMARADRYSIQKAKLWIQNINAVGLTDILTPYSQAVRILSQKSTTSVSTSSSSYGERPLPPGFSHPTHDPVETTEPVIVHGAEAIPTTVLITDGAVYNEIDICNYAKNLDTSSKGSSSSLSIRTFTFGIGPYCNQCFLKTLAAMGHGYSDICLFPELLYQQMIQLMSKTIKPVFTSIHMESLDNKTISWYPDTVADLCVGAPLMMSGVYHGAQPRTFTVTGANTDGLTQRYVVTPYVVDQSIPIHQLVCRQKIDCILGLWWLERDASSAKKKSLRDECVAASVDSNIPCVFTTTVAYEDKEVAHQQHVPVATALLSHPASFSSVVPVGVFAAVAAASTSSKPTASTASANRRHHNPRTNKAVNTNLAIKLTAAAAVAVVFGSIAATNSNNGVLDAMVAITSYGFSPAVFQSLGVVFNHVEGIGGDVLQFTVAAGRDLGHTVVSVAQSIAPDISHAAHVVGGGIQAGAHDIESGISQAVDAAPSLMNDCSNCCTSCCGHLAGCDFIGIIMTVFNFLAQLLGHTINLLVGILNGCGDCCGAICNGDILGQCGDICSRYVTSYYVPITYLI